MPPVAATGLTVTPIKGVPRVEPGDDLATILVEALKHSQIELQPTDVVVVAQKIVSKAEGAIVQLSRVESGEEALKVAQTVDKDPRLVEVILNNSKRIVRSVPGVLITETLHGFICANAGVDSSNTGDTDTVILLPVNPDLSARQLREQIAQKTGVPVSVVVSDTFNRPWRQGSMNVAIGTAGFVPLQDARGSTDDNGKVLHATMVSIADEIASAAQLVMGESHGTPSAVVHGLKLEASDDGSGSLLRKPEKDLFR